MEKITYLLGAGASAQVLPLIRESTNDTSKKPGLPSALYTFLEENKQIIMRDSNWDENKFNKLRNIVQKCKVFGTPDLVAKYYLETADENNYYLLKRLVSTYFHIIEKTENLTGNGFEGWNLDSRVVPFLTTISNKRRIPSELKIISWNYDTQIEMGAKKLQPVSGKSNDFNINFNVWPFNAGETDREDKDYFLLHLNGICGYIYSPKHLAIGNPYTFDFDRPLEPLLSFAWEDDDSFKKETFTQKRLQLAKKMIDKTTILVIIGYSFPFFNRKVDAELFSMMHNTLRKIYFQDPNLDGQFLYNQFGLYKDYNEMMGPGQNVVDIVSIKDVSQFHVPFEL